MSTSPGPHPQGTGDYPDGRAIAAARKARRLTQAELARNSAVSLSQVRKIEQGTRTLTPAVRSALAAALGQARPAGQDTPASARTATIWRLASQYAKLAELVPGLITTLTTAAFSASGYEQEQMFGLLALAYSNGVRLIDAATGSRPFDDSAAALASHGALLMRSAVLAARAGKPGEAADRLAEAGAAARRLPESIYHGTAFGPASVRVHELALAVESHDIGHAINVSSQWEPPLTLPAERRSHFYIEAARAHSWAGNQDKATGALWQARRAAPSTPAATQLSPKPSRPWFAAPASHRPSSTSS